MILFGHHSGALFEIEIMGREFPETPMEHALAYSLTAIVLTLMVYGLYAVVRDLLGWRRRRAMS